VVLGDVRVDDGHVDSPVDAAAGTRAVAPRHRDVLQRERADADTVHHPVVRATLGERVSTAVERDRVGTRSVEQVAAIDGDVGGHGDRRDIGSLKFVASRAAVLTSTAPAGSAVATTKTGTAMATAASAAINDRRDRNTPRISNPSSPSWHPGTPVGPEDRR